MAIKIGSTVVIDNSKNLTNIGTINSGAITATTLNTGQGANELYDMDQNVKTSSSPTFVNSYIGGTLTIGTEVISATDVENWKHDYTEHLHHDDGIVNKATFDNWHFILGNMKVFGGIKATGNVGNGGSVDISFGGNHGSVCTQKPVGCHFNTYGASFSYATNMLSSQTYKITIVGQFGSGRNIMWTCFCTTDSV